MTKNRLSLLLAFAAMAIVAVGGFFLAVQPQLALAANAREQTATVEQTNATSRVELARLKAQAAKLPAMRDELSSLTRSVPESASVSSFIDELDGIAADTGMQVSAFTASDATAYQPAATAAGSASSAATPAPGAAATATPAPSATPAEPTAPSIVTNAAITGQNFSVIPVTVAVDGTFDQALRFVQGVQTGKRLFLITSITSAQQTGDDGSAATTATWTFGGSIYVLDRSADSGATAGATAAKNG
ncbi:hypothetical protein [Curtobacterium sp. DN_7.5]|uniref:hypothetical protein n=1 Tax=Curtobacterium sp. DN_7.5 TaxID=3049047 RepID=UPI001F5AA5A9|nr:hypothetical protein [Curtobacterium sp. DN_7.5]